MCKFLVKYLLFFINFTIVILGAAITGLGVYVYFHIDILTDLSPIDVDSLPLGIIIIVTGSLLFVISFSGCCGSICESRWLLIMYACMMFLLAAIKIAIVVILFTNMTEYQTKIETRVNNTFVSNHNNTFHVLETLLKCCGTTGPDSYDNLEVFENGNYLPSTCCENIDKCLTEGESNHEYCICEKEDAYQDGCSATLGNYFRIYAHYIGYVIIICIIFEVLSLVSALYLNNIITISKRQHKY